MVNKKSEPLLYIHQPEFPVPETDMQDIFMNEEEEIQVANPSVPAAAPVEKGNQAEELLPKDAAAEKHLTSAEYFRQSRTTWKSPYFKPAVPFRNLPIQEKIEYLKQALKHQPPIACEFKTKDKTMLGTFSKHENDTISIQTFADGEVKVTIAELTGIRLIG